MNTIKDLFDLNELGKYNNLGWPNNVSMLHDRLLSKLKEDPDYEVWVTFHYIGSPNATEATEEIHDDGILVSSKGRLFRKFTGRRTDGASSKEDGYRFIQLTCKEKGLRHNLGVARVVACCYVPTPTDKKIVNLVTNHKDLDKANNDFTNLEWTTQSDNVKHAIANGAREYTSGLEYHSANPIKGTVTDHGRFNGLTFVLVGQKQIDTSGFISARLVADGKLNQTRGCKFQYITVEEAKTLKPYDDLPTELKQLFVSHNSSFKDTIYGMHTITLEVRPFIGTESMKKEGLSSQGVYQSVSGTGSNAGMVKGWMFVRQQEGETLDEITQRLTDKVLDYYRNSKYRTRCLIGTNIKTGEEVLFVGKKKLLEMNMNPKLAYKEADVPNHTYKGFSLREVPFELDYIKLM